MEHDVFEDLAKAGVNAVSAIERFMQNEALYYKFLNKFLSDTNFGFLEQSLQKKEYAIALQHSHTLKGVCGNLGMIRLYNTFDTMVLQLRDGEYGNMEQLFQEAKISYDMICNYIKENL